MMKLLDITEKYGKATYSYPLEPYAVPENFRGKPQYTFDLCIGCTACGVACPSNAIEVKMNKEQTKLVWEFNCGRCIFCGRCDEVCPTGAVRLSNEYELAVKFNKDDLIQRGELDIETCKCCNQPFTVKRLIKFALDRMKNARLSDERIAEAEDYLHICPKCKEQRAVDKMTKGLEGEIK